MMNLERSGDAVGTMSGELKVLVTGRDERLLEELAGLLRANPLFVVESRRVRSAGSCSTITWVGDSTRTIGTPSPNQTEKYARP
jgi:hypothetical protein